MYEVVAQKIQTPSKSKSSSSGPKSKHHVIANNDATKIL